jgi:hypothetical protein
MLARFEEEMMAMIKVWRQTNMKDNGEERMVCQETMEARLEVEEPGSVDMTPEVANEEVPWEDAARIPVAEPRKRRWD